MTITERNKVNEAKMKLESVRSDILSREENHTFDKAWFSLTNIVNFIDELLEDDLNHNGGTKL